MRSTEKNLYFERKSERKKERKNPVKKEEKVCFFK